MSLLLWTVVTFVARHHHHATFASTQARQIAHRWRPVQTTEVVNDELRAASNDVLRRYTRVLHHLETHPGAFGLVVETQQGDDAPHPVVDRTLSLLVLHPATRKTVVIQAALWPRDDDVTQRAEALRAAQRWHFAHFGKRLVLGPGLELSDRIVP